MNVLSVGSDAVWMESKREVTLGSSSVYIQHFKDCTSKLDLQVTEQGNKEEKKLLQLIQTYGFILKKTELKYK